MKYEIQSINDESFTIQSKPFGEQYIATDGERVVIAVTEEQAVEGVQELQEQNKIAEVNRGPKPAPIENKVYGGTGWFEGTPWSTNNR